MAEPADGEVASASTLVRVALASLEARAGPAEMVATFSTVNAVMTSLDGHLSRSARRLGGQSTLARGGSGTVSGRALANKVAG